MDSTQLKRKRDDESSDDGSSDSGSAHSDNQERHPTPDISRRYQTHGNMWLVSSDGLRFKCWDYNFKSASHIFEARLRDRVTDSSSLFEYTFDDKFIEDGKTIAMLVGAFSEDLSQFVGTHVPDDQIFKFSKLLRQWHLTALEDHLKAIMTPRARHPEVDGQIQSHPEMGSSPRPAHFCGHQVFAVGAIFGDVDLCVAAIEFSPVRRWCKKENGYLYDGDQHTPCLDLRGAALGFMEIVPIDWSVALLRASNRRSFDSREDRSAIAREFERLMDWAK